MRKRYWHNRVHFTNASNDIPYDIKIWYFTPSQGQLLTWIVHVKYQSMCLWYKHSYIHFVFLLQFDRKLLTKNVCWAEMASDGLIRDKYENIEPWSLRTVSIISIPTKQDWSDQYHGSEKHINIHPFWLAMRSPHKKWHDIRPHTAKIWDTRL